MTLTDMDYDPSDDKILMFKTEELITRAATSDAAYKLQKVITERPKSIVAEVKLYRKYVPLLIKSLAQMEMIKQAAVKQNERFTNDCEEKAHKKWTAEEDNMLIDLVVDGNMSMMELATTLGRSVTAIKTRLSILVGRKRLSQKIVGKFIGEIDGVKTESSINGTVYKER